MSSRRFRPLTWVVLLCALSSFALAADAAQAARDLEPRWSARVGGGAIALTGNSQLTCSPSVMCTQSLALSPRSSTPTPNRDNGFSGMRLVDADTDLTTASSSSARLVMPEDATVMYARLYWSARGSATDPATRTVRLKSSGAYQPITADTVDGVAGTDPAYQASADVTPIVAAGGATTYTVADLPTSTGSDYAGWSLVVGYHFPEEASRFRHISIHDGLGAVAPGQERATVIDDFLMPKGAFRYVDLGVVAWDGDRGETGDTLQLDGRAVSNSFNPAANVFNSTISREDVELRGERTPSESHTFGVDIDDFPLYEGIAPGRTSSTLRFATTGDSYMPGVAAFSIDLEAPQLTSTLEVTDSSPGDLRPGDTLTVRPLLDNRGLAAASGVVTRIPIPAQTTVTSFNGGTVQDGVFTATVPDLAAGGTNGSPWLRLRVASVPDNTPVALTSTTTYGHPAYRTAFTATSRFSGLVQAPDLRIALARSRALEAGSSVEYVADVSNHGSVATRLPTTVALQLPPTLTGATAQGTGWTCKPDLTCAHSGTIPAGGHAGPLRVSAIVSESATGTLRSAATLSGGGDSTPDDNTAADEAPVLQRAELSVTMDADRTTANVNDPVALRMRVTNAGPSRALGTAAQLSLPRGWKLDANGSPACGRVDELVLRCSVGELGREQSRDLTAVLIPTAGAAGLRTALVAHVSQSPPATDTNATDDVAVVDIDVTQPDVALSTRFEPDPPVAGRPLTATITAGNSGASEAEQVNVPVRVPPEWTDQRVSAGAAPCAKVTGDFWECELGRLGAGERSTIEVTGRVRPTARSIDVAASANVSGRDKNSDDNGTWLFRPTVDPGKPTITGKADPEPNAAGWYRDAVRVSFECADEESGIASCEPPTLLEDETAVDSGGQIVSGTAADRFGNTAQASVGPIRIDKTPPTLVGAPTREANGFGWYREDVTVGWTATDGLSGVDADTVPADSVVTGEGKGLRAPRQEVRDIAGNAGASDGPAIDIDRTAPDVQARADGRRGEGGWFTGPVTVGFECADALSGVATCPAPVVLAEDGRGQSAAGTAADQAGNEATARVDGVDVDSRAPVSTADLRCEKVDRFCRTSATVTVHATDAGSGSGVDRIRYRVGTDGDWTTVAGDVATVDVALSGAGKAVVQYRAIDKAGNEEAVGSADVEHDGIAPNLAHELRPAANAAGWNNSATTLHWLAGDADSGLLSVSDPVLVDQDTAGSQVTGTAQDRAGNVTSGTATVRLDRTAPTIKATTTAGAPGLFGWQRSPVRVRYACADPGAVASGVVSCPEDQWLQNEQRVTGTVVDAAGNRASTTVGPFKVDATAPAITVKGIADGGVYTLGRVPSPGCSAADSGSGTLGCVMAVYGGRSNGVGTFGFTAVSIDFAGNLSTVNGTFSVRYALKTGTAFWQAPINDTANVAGLATSVFKAGSTVAARFRLTDADGRTVRASEDPVWLTPAKGRSTKLPVDEAVYTAPASSGDEPRWTGSGYQYDWKAPTAGAGSYWRIGVRLDDGTQQTVSIALK